MTGQRDNQLRYGTKGVFLTHLTPYVGEPLNQEVFELQPSIVRLNCSRILLLRNYTSKVKGFNGARWNRTADTQGFNLLLYLTELSRLNAPIFSELVDMSKSIHGSIPFLFQRTSHRHYTDWLLSPI